MTQSSRFKTQGSIPITSALLGTTMLLLAALAASAQTNVPAPAVEAPEIRTPPAPATPRINGAAVFGVRPGHPFLYRIPATGDRPMEFSVANLPPGLKVDSQTGQITGVISNGGQYTVTFQAKNAKGRNEKSFKIIAGETIALTPPMGWNSWNLFKGRVNAEIVLAAAKAMSDSGLINHGWTFVNIDDTWQGDRGGPFHALQGNQKFPDMKSLCDQIHAMGLKFGIYSTPWVTSYAGYPGGSATNADGAWVKPPSPKQPNKKILPWAIGQYSFASNDAKQFGAWGVDYLKYDWNPIEIPETQEMYDGLRNSGRDVIYSLSNNTPFTNAAALSKIANCWRTSGDIRPNWQSMTRNGFRVDRWRPYASPGHWNDPDMLEVGNGNLTPDEQYTHITLWCLVSSPLLLGNDLTKLTPFLLNLLENDEVLAVNQDALGDQAATVSSEGDLRVYSKKLQDGTKAVGLFNMGDTGPATVTVKWSDLGLSGKQSIRDLWRQKELGQFDGQFEMKVASHGAEMVSIRPAH